MKALTVCEPYATLIARGIKRIENRPWRTAYRGPLVICAGKSQKWRDPGLEAEFNLTDDDLHFGQAVCLVTLTDTVAYDLGAEQRQHRLWRYARSSRWASGPECWILRDPRPLEPFAVRGQPGLFEIDDSLVAAHLED